MKIQAPRDRRGASGVVWMGPAYDRGGYGAVTRNYLRGLARIGFPVKLLPFGPRHAEIDDAVASELRSLERAPVGSSPALVVHSTPERFRFTPPFGFVRRIGCTIFETDRLPQHWIAPCNSMDEVWVPSQFNVDTFTRAGVDGAKLVSIPYGIDTSRYTPSEIKRTEGPFTFLYVCVFSWRKGLDLLLASFLNEFRRGEARLVMRVYSDGYEGVAGDEVERVLYESVDGLVQKAADERPEVQIITRAQSSAELKRLYESADLYISTDRANGWGVPCQEAMALGVPAATIDWSGSTEFMHEDNSVLIHPEDELVPVDRRLADAVPDLYAGHRWARVEPAEVRRAMRWALEHPVQLAAIARAGQKHVRSALDFEAVARRMVDRLSTLEPSAIQRAAGAARLYTLWTHAIGPGERLVRRR
jgi:glycosyltransferase involved in cell wall biosynthesis